MLQIKNLTKHFGGVKAVNNCSFKVKKNSVTALIGPNGSGKTTVFNLISQLVDEDFGEIFLEKTDISKFSPTQVAQTGVSRLYQKAQLFENLTVKENLLLALSNEDTKFWKNFLSLYSYSDEQEKKVMKALERIHLQNYKDTLTRELSYGQKRLVEIMRTILQPHKLLLFDEPVAGVMPKLREEIAKIIRELKKEGDTILLIEHDMNFALNLADEVIVLDEGKVIARGTPEEIRQNKKVLEAYLGE